jgi:hypothetical protein
VFHEQFRNPTLRLEGSTTEVGCHREQLQSVTNPQQLPVDLGVLELNSGALQFYLVHLGPMHRLGLDHRPSLLAGWIVTIVFVAHGFTVEQLHRMPTVAPSTVESLHPSPRMHPRKISSARDHCLPILAAQAAGQQTAWTSAEKHISAASQEKNSPTIIVGKNHQRP